MGGGETVLLSKDRMSSSPPTPWWDRVRGLQNWRDGFGSDAEMCLLLPPCQWLDQIPHRAASSVVLTTPDCGKVAGKGLL